MHSENFEPADLFQCQRCGDCCRGFGGTYVTPVEIKVIAAFMKIEVKRFRSKFCQVSGQRLVLSQAENGYCIFWKGDCSIHPVKPRMCRRWPFIESVLIDIENWQIMAGVCPGIRSDVPDWAVRRCVEQAVKKDTI